MKGFYLNNAFLLSRTLTLLMAICFSFRTSAADFYVDERNPGANDANSGTATSPWKTIGKANQSLAAGDTVHIKQGSYQDFVAPARSGTANNRITYRNYSNDVVKIENTTYGVHLDGKSWIVVQGITFTNLDAMMILENSANNNTIAYCNFVRMRNLST